MKKRKLLKDLAIVIVTHNSQFWLEKTLTTLKKFYLSNTKRKIQVVVVDNASQDNTLAMLKDNFPWAKLIQLNTNLGFAHANNQAIIKTPAKNYLLLNSDTELNEKSNLDTILNFIQRKTQVGIITPKLIFSNGKLDPACHRGEPTPLASLFYFLGLEKLFPLNQKFGQYHQTYKDPNTIHTIDACSGAALIIKKTVIDKIGLLDTRFFMYAEDLDWCKRAREAGFLVVYHPGVSIVHHKHKSGIKNSSQLIRNKTKRYFFDTMLQYFDKHYAKNYPKFLRLLLNIFISLKKGGV